MQREDAVVGGEGNGGVVLPELQHTRDAPVGAALLLQYLADEPETPLSSRVARLPSYTIVKEKMPLARGALGAAYARLARVLPPEDRDESDGLRMDWPSRGSWLHVRPSGTEPVVRVIAEAGSGAAARKLVDRAREVLAEAAAG
jgi:phosphomannomutase